MIVLDTNVVSALMQREPASSVIIWLNGQPALSIWTTTITVFEVRLGIELLAPSRRRRQLQDGFETILASDLGARVLPFDEAAARAAASFAAERRQAGRTAQVHDVQIAGIVASRKAQLATRDVRDFDGLGLHIINPWAQ